MTLPKEKDMKMQDIREIARKQGIKSGKLTKLALVQAIQESEQNTPCFGTTYVNTCGQEQCLWREDCLALRKKS
jgi:hypothetical protein